MKTISNNSLISWTAFIALVVIIPFNYASADKKEYYKVEVTGGSHILLPNSKPVDGWQRLLAFQTKLREKLQLTDGADEQGGDVGCDLCASNEPALRSDGTFGPPTTPQNKVTYRFDVDDRERVAPFFAAAYDRVQKDKDLTIADFEMKILGPVPVGESCSTDYLPPCYNRPVCTLYSGCSRSQTSCVKCVK